MNVQAVVKCPRCGKEWTVNRQENEAECNCHLYCDMGQKPSDCTLTVYTLNHEVGAPYGLHTGSPTGDDDPTHIQYYCSVHDRYSYKVPILIPFNWEGWLGKRAPAKYRKELTL